MTSGRKSRALSAPPTLSPPLLLLLTVHQGIQVMSSFELGRYEHCSTHSSHSKFMVT
jgi:hypothetical protein